MPTIDAQDDLRLLSIEQALAMTGLSRTTFYRLRRDGDIRTVKVGSRTLVPVKSLRDWMEGLTYA